MGRVAKKSDLTKADLKGFSISLTEARNLKITKEDLKGIKELIPNEKYKIRITVGNRKSETFDGTLLEAIKRKKELLNDNKDKKVVVDDDIYFLECVDLFIADCYEREARGEMDINSIYDHIRKIDADITDYFARYKLREITTAVIEDFLTYMRRRPNKNDPTKKLSEQSIANHLRTLNTILNFAKRKKLIDVNPIDDATNKPKARKQKKELTYFKISEAVYALKCLDKFADVRLQAFMNIIFSLGCRREECAGLRWMDVDFRTGEVTYNYAVTSTVPKKYVKDRVRTKELKTDNSYRTNILSTKALKFLKKYYNFKIMCGFDIAQEDFIFTSWKANVPCDPNKLSEQWRNFKKEYNIKNVDLHRIRHTVANILEKMGVPKKDIAKMLGNTERVLEEYYTHVDIEELRTMRNKLDSVLYNEIDFIELDIDMVVKILNEYPLESMTKEQLSKLDYISTEKICDNNYLSMLKLIKEVILTSDSNLIYFIDEDDYSLNIKKETYKKFNNDNKIKVKRIKDVPIKKDIFSF